MIGTLGSTYIFIVIFVDIRLAIFATTFTIDGSLFFLPYFVRHDSLIVLVYIGMLFIASNKGILTHPFFNSFKKSRSKGVIYFSNNNLFGKGGDLVNCDCSFWVSTDFCAIVVLGLLWFYFSFSCLVLVWSLDVSFTQSRYVTKKMEKFIVSPNHWQQSLYPYLWYQSHSLSSITTLF